MRVAVISGAFPPMAAGEATNAYHLCHRLARRGIDVHVLTSHGNAAVAEPSIKVYPVMQSWSWPEVPRLTSFLRRSRPDVVYLMYLGWMYSFQFMPTFVPTIARRALPGVRIVTRFENVHGAFAQHNSTSSRVIRKMVAQLCAGPVNYQFGTLLSDSDGVVVLSSRHGEFLEQCSPGVARKIALQPPPSNMVMSAEGEETRLRGRDALGVPGDSFLFVYLGFVYPGKGIETLLRAFARVVQKTPSARLAVIGGRIASRDLPSGPDYFADMRALSDSLGLGHRVVWTGEYAWDSDQASSYLRAADACVLPFDSGVRLNNSSFSSAAAHGLPIVSTMGEDIEPQFVDRCNVLLCRPESPESLSDAMMTLAGDKALQARLADGARSLARDLYSWDKSLDFTLSLLRGTN